MSSESLKEEEKRLCDEMGALGRPAFEMGSGVPAWQRMPAVAVEQAEWDRANPEKAARRKAILTKLDAIKAELDKIQAEEDKRKRLFDRLHRVGVGVRNMAALKDGIEKTEAIEAVERREEEGKTFLLLTGAPGTGKSLAAAVAVERILKADPPLMHETAVFARAFQCTRYSLFAEEDVAAVNAMRRCRLLVVDDLGVESYHDTWRQTFEDVMDARYQNRLVTILTTNLDPSAFKERYGERIADRIRHDGLVAKCGAKSMRRAS